jgi:hypothetical protein
MKYLHDLPIQAIENINRAAWVRRLGHPKNPEDVTEFLCHMVIDEENNQAELHIHPEDEQWFSASEKSRMSDTRTIPDPPILDI